MKSTSISESHKNILEIRKLSITFTLNLFKSHTFRDVFVKFIQSPFKFFFIRPAKLYLLKEIDFDVKRGEKVAIVGINGAGKTSLCRTIAGMYGTKKEITVNGRVRAIFDTASVVHPELSGYENVTIITDIIYSHLSKKERLHIIQDSIQFSEIGDLIDSPFKFYSKGMKVRLFLSVVSAAPCDLLILDEVFDGADTFFNEKISIRIKAAIKDSGAVLFISHSETTIKEVCNRVIVLGDTKILFDGSTDEGMAFYRSYFKKLESNEI